MRTKLRNYYLKLVGNITQIKPGIHILNSHYITPDYPNLEKDSFIFEEFLLYLNKFGTFITLEEATQRILSKNIPKEKIYLSFTFDDGFEECYSVIAPILEKFDTRGTFFINSNYISSNLEYQEQFHKRVKTFTKKPMTWDQIVDLHNRGHIIGSHSLDHKKFSALQDDEIQFQIKKNKEIIERKVNIDCDFFSWTYGQLRHFPPNALEITKKFHKYIFSDTNYQYYFSYNSNVINRRHIEPFWPKSHVNYFLGKTKKYT